MPLAVEGWSLNHWTTIEVPTFFFKTVYFCIDNIRHTSRYNVYNIDTDMYHNRKKKTFFLFAIPSLHSAPRFE